MFKLGKFQIKTYFTIRGWIDEVTAKAEVAPVVEGAREADGANGHNPQQDKFDRPSLDAPMAGEP